jgi:hypothetical protein
VHADGKRVAAGCRQPVEVTRRTSKADWIKREQKVTVVISDPPDREKAEGWAAGFSRSARR